MRTPFRPFTDVLSEIRREVTRKMRKDRRVSLQRALGHGRSRVNADRAGRVRANAQSQSDNHDSKRAEIATRKICHFVRSLRRLRPPISASACGTAVAHPCKLRCKNENTSKSGFREARARQSISPQKCASHGLCPCPHGRGFHPRRRTFDHRPRRNYRGRG
jgi:hypothetical protein